MVYSIIPYVRKELCPMHDYTLKLNINYVTIINQCRKVYISTSQDLNLSFIWHSRQHTIYDQATARVYRGSL